MVRRRWLFMLGVALILASSPAIVGGAPATGFGAPAVATPLGPDAFAFGLAPVADGFERPVHVVDPGDGSGRLFSSSRRG